MFYLIAKNIDDEGCVALRMTYGKHLSSFKKSLMEKVMKKKLLFLFQLVIMVLLIFPMNVKAGDGYLFWHDEDRWEWEFWLEDIYVENVLENENVDRESETFRAEFETYMQRIKARIDTMTFDDYYNLESSYSLSEVSFISESFLTRYEKRATPTADGFVMYGDVLFDYVGNASTVVIPSTVTRIYGFNFDAKEKHSVDQIIIPASVVDIRCSFDMENYDDAEKGQAIQIKFEERNGKPLKIGDWCFLHMKSKSLKNLLPKETTEIGKYCFAFCELFDFKLPSGIKELPEGTFYGFDNCSFEIPSSVTRIDDHVLERIYGLDYPEGYVTIPSSVKSIGKDCFIGLDNNGILCKKGSVAEQYCKKNKLTYRTDGNIKFAKKTYYVCVGTTETISINTYSYADKAKFSVKSNPYIKMGTSKQIDNEVWIDGKKPGKVVLAATYKGKKYQTKIEVLSLTVNNRVKQAVNNATNSKMTKEEKAWSLSGWLQGQCMYDLNYLDTGKKSGKHSPHTVEGALLDGYAVCDGFALATKKLFDKAGLESKVVYGTYYGMGHAWNLVKTEDGWVHMDNTNFMGVYALDKEMKSSGYKWDEKKYPKTKKKW